ncbi:hypothetical protein TIFTF001_054800 [Ficus carica]|uniref:Uncharacterized protein n=1 Tax=Ficus carica TaxID=3494 RepID=A0AA88EDN0_FICCA|nr:hypothetical protein TIFTF001_054800 [Ficus carica]
MAICNSPSSDRSITSRSRPIGVSPFAADRKSPSRASSFDRHPDGVDIFPTRQWRERGERVHRSNGRKREEREWGCRSECEERERVGGGRERKR